MPQITSKTIHRDTTSHKYSRAELLDILGFNEDADVLTIVYRKEPVEELEIVIQDWYDDMGEEVPLNERA